MKVRGVFGEWFDFVFVDDKLLDPKKSQKIVNHSPDGFAWGYSGSGPAQLALAVLLEAGLPVTKAIQFHQALKTMVVARLPDRQDFEFEIDIQLWVDDREQEMAKVPRRRPDGEAK